MPLFSYKKTGLLTKLWDSLQTELGFRSDDDFNPLLDSAIRHLLVPSRVAASRLPLALRLLVPPMKSS